MWIAAIGEIGNVLDVFVFAISFLTVISKEERFISVGRRFKASFGLIPVSKVKRIKH